MKTENRRKPTATRKEEIIRAVLKIVGRRGMAALTTTALAKEVGVTSGALFRHFHSRDEMLLETVRHAAERIARTFPDPNLPPLERLLALAQNRVRLLGADPGLAWFLRSEQAYLAIPEEGVEILRTIVARSRKFMLAALKEGVAGGEIRGDIDAETLLVPVVGTIHALIGMPGVHRSIARGADDVLDALATLLAPPGGARTISHSPMKE